MSDSPKIKLVGSCKCGSIKYKMDAKVDSEGSVKGTRCSCTFCTKLGTTMVYLDGPEDFELLTPASYDALGLYAPRIKTLPRYFCKECGSHVFMQGYYPLGPDKRRDMMAVNLATVDQPQEALDLKDVKIQYFDGLYDNQAKGAADTPFTGGLL